MMIDQIVDYLQKEWSTVKSVPLTIFVITLLLCGCVYQLLHWYFSERMESLSSRVEGLKEENQRKSDLIADYRYKLQGASPEQASNQISSLLQKIEILERKEDVRKEKEWHPLSKEQISEWIDKLTPYEIRFFAIFYADQYSQELRESLNTVLKELKWRGPAANMDNAEGIRLRANPNEPAALALIELFKNAGYNIEWQPTQEERPSEITLYIGFKPK